MTMEGGLPTILVVDDEEILRSYIARVLECDGYCVIEAEDGVEALSLLGRKDRGADVDLVITDVRMPRMGGKGPGGHPRSRPLVTAGIVHIGHSHAVGYLRAAAQEAVHAR